MKVEMGKRYTTVNGREVEILYVNRPKPYLPVVAMFKDDGVIKQCQEDGTIDDFSGIKLVELWTPSDGEWCWFWDKDEPTHYVLDRFKMIGTLDLFQSTNVSTWKYCAKFTGELPEHLKALKYDSKI
ncbi:MAG: hypothetical protein JHC33_01235 [Ignisphaera sp.]|nr:hypothetical protein [Ignisphaera sp.]